MHTEAEEFVTSVLSLVCRLPPFDYYIHNNHYYLRIRSDEFIRVRHTKVVSEHSKQPIGSEIVVIPTDDARFKIIIIPQDCLHNVSDNLAIAT